MRPKIVNASLRGIVGFPFSAHSSNDTRSICFTHVFICATAGGKKKWALLPSTTYGFLTPIRVRSKLMQCCTLGTVNCQFGTLCLAQTLTLCLLRQSHCFRGLSQTWADVNLKDKHRYKHECVHIHTPTRTHTHTHTETLKDNYAKTYICTCTVGHTLQ